MKELEVAITKAVTLMAESLRDGSVTKMTFASWIELLQDEDLTPEQVIATAKKICKTRKYKGLPTTAEFIEMAKGHVEKDLRSVAEAQADLVVQTVRRVGPYTTPTWEDPITAYLMTTRWKWYSFASGLESDKTVFWRREFVEAYCDLAIRGLPEAGPALEAGTVKRIAAKAEPKPTPPGSPEAKKGVESIKEVLENLGKGEDDDE